MSQNQFTDRTWSNLFQTLLLFGGMVVLLGLLGFWLGGTGGLMWALVLSVPLLLLGGHASPRLVLRLVGAQPLPPHAAPDLYALVAELGRRAGLSTAPRLYYIASPAANALSVGEGEDAALAVTAGLLQRLDHRELAGVLAHEITHLQHRDTRLLSLAHLIRRLTGLLSRLGQFLLFVNLPLLVLHRTTIPWGAILLLMLAPALSGLLQLALARTREFSADLGAVRLTGDPVGLARALQRIDVSQDGILGRVLGPAALRTHPYTSVRVERLLSLIDRQQPARHEPFVPSL